MASLRHRYRDALYDSDLGRKELAVALALERYMSSKGLDGAYSSVETLGILSRFGESSVQRPLRELERRGWITPTRQRPSIVRPPSRGVSLTPLTPSRGVLSTPLGFVPKFAQGCRERPPGVYW